MDRTGLWLAASAIALGGVLGVAAVAQKPEDKAPISGKPWSAVEVRAEKLAEGVYVLFGEGGNIGVSVGDDGALLIDDQFAPLTPRILAAVAALTKKPVRFVCNTHWHFDHVGGNENLANAGALIVAHDNVRARLASGLKGALMGDVPPAPARALPVVTFADSLELHVNGEDVRVLHVAPAHTDGDSLVQLRKANVIHMGDLMMTVSYPLIDSASGGRYSGFIEAADRALALADASTKIIPGHGPVTDRAGLQAWREMLATIRERVREQAAAGKSLEEIQKAGLSKEWDAKWGAWFVGPEKIAAAAYAEVAPH